MWGAVWSAVSERRSGDRVGGCMASERWRIARQAHTFRSPGWEALSMTWRETLHRGVVIPAHPLALTEGRKLDERRQRALTRYYLSAGAGGVAVGVHTTQFAIHDSTVGLYRPVLELAAAELKNTSAIR